MQTVHPLFSYTCASTQPADKAVEHLKNHITNTGEENRSIQRLSSKQQLSRRAKGSRRKKERTRTRSKEDVKSQLASERKDGKRKIQRTAWAREWGGRRGRPLGRTNGRHHKRQV